MEPFDETASTREVLKAKLRENFDGRIVRKDLTKKIKEGANVPVYVLEFLLGQYCSSDDEEVIEKGVQQVKRILADNFVRPDEAQKILSLLRSRGSYTIIDKITVQLNIKRIAMKRSSPTLVLMKSLSKMSILKSTIACCAVAFGASFNFPTRAKNSQMLWPALDFDPTKRKRTVLRSYRL